MMLSKNDGEYPFDYGLILDEIQAKITQGIIDALTQRVSKQSGMVNQDFIPEEFHEIVHPSVVEDITDISSEPIV